MYKFNQRWSAVLAILALISVAGHAQQASDTSHVSPWRHSLIAGLNLTQIDFSHWTAGGTDALAYIASLNGKSERDSIFTNWTTDYKLDFGQTKLDHHDIQKTDDEINLQSVLTFKFGVHVNPYVSAALLTQFAPGYNYPDTGAPVQVSNFFDPAYLRQSAGVGYKLSEAFETRLGVGLREIITHHYTQYTGDPSKKVKVQGGAESITDIQFEVDKNVLFRTKLDFFEPFEELDRPIMHAEATLIAKVSKIFSAELGALFISDPDVSPFMQIKEGLSIGIAYVLL
ncbi:MAG TPA: DUF3078 domain-containing protein [Candidatus Kapabacteria bacterium]|jgi:hypothetical protein|nr:DUF3078 domain-containing protein [Candidatus Kapabacteria bacterium]